MNHTLKEFEEALAKDKELREAFDEKCKKIVEAKEADNDGEVLVKAAEQLGWSLSMEELERIYADREELSEEDLEQISGGDYDYIDPRYEDEQGHDTICVMFWHCYTIMRHTDAEDEYTACWSNYSCWAANHMEYIR